MMQRLVQLKQPIRLYLEDTMSEDEVKSYDLSDHQWSVVKSILSLLEGVDQVAKTLSGERYSTLSWCLPSLFVLGEVSKYDRNDNNVLSAIKKKSIEQLNAQFELNALQIDSPMILSTALDPRFRKLPFLTESQQTELMEALVNTVGSIPCSTSGCIDTTDDATETVEPLSKKKSVLD